MERLKISPQVERIDLNALGATAANARALESTRATSSVPSVHAFSLQPLSSWNA
jgi:hypothetical protein